MCVVRTNNFRFSFVAKVIHPLEITKFFGVFFYQISSTTLYCPKNQRFRVKIYWLHVQIFWKEEKIAFFLKKNGIFFVF